MRTDETSRSALKLLKISSRSALKNRPFIEFVCYLFTLCEIHGHFYLFAEVKGRFWETKLPDIKYGSDLEGDGAHTPDPDLESFKTSLQRTGQP